MRLFFQLLIEYRQKVFELKCQYEKLKTELKLYYHEKTK